MVAMILVIPVCFAQISISDVRIYIDEERQSNIDEDGGDVTMYSDALILDMVIEIDNTENTTSQAKIRGTFNNIDDGNDIVKEQVYFEIPSNDAKSKMLSFSLPTDIIADEYDLDLRVWLKYNNGTEIIKDVTYTIDYKKTTGDTTPINLQASFNNLTTICGNITSSLGSMFTYVSQYTTCSNELTSAKEQRGSFESQFNTCNADLIACKSERTEIDRLKQTAENERDSRVTEEACVNRENTVKQTTEDNYMKIMAVAVLGGGAFWWYSNKKKKTGTVDGTYYYEKTR